MTERDMASLLPLPRRLPWERQRVGIVLGPSRAIAIEVRRGVDAWTMDGPGADAAGGYGAALDALVRRIPRPTGAWRGCEIVVALGNDVTQVKRIFGLPMGADLQTATAIVREGASRFFRRTADLMLTSDLHEREDGSRWASAYRGDVVHEIVDASARYGAKLTAIIPTGMAGEQAPGLEASSVLQEARDTAMLRASDLQSRLAAPAGTAPASTTGPRGQRAAVLAAAIALAMLMVVPLASARVTARNAATEHASLRTQERSALGLAEELRRVSEMLDEIGARDAERRSSIELLSHLAAALPAGSVLTHLQVDTAGGTLIVLSPSTERVLTDLEANGRFAALEIVGPVSRERVGDRELDRVSLRFRHVPADVDRLP